MRGFDSNWHDVRGFITGITKEIWECREIDSLRKRPADGLIVCSPALALVGNSYVIAANMATLAEFPTAITHSSTKPRSENRYRS
jgi:hypothetical protein